jgi:hypothetical protein
MTTEQPAPFRVGDLIAWAEIADFAAQAKDPTWPYKNHDIWIHSRSHFPSPDELLPNAFHFPTTTMSAHARAVYFVAIGRYCGPAPTTCAGFVRAQTYIAKTFQAELTADTARRIRRVLIGEHSVPPDQASAMPLDEAMNLLAPLAPPKKKARCGRTNLADSTEPKDVAKLAAYRLIREVLAKNPTWGPVKLYEHFSTNKPQSLMEELRTAECRLTKPFVRAATAWIKENDPVQKTRAENVS